MTPAQFFVSRYVTRSITENVPLCVLTGKDGTGFYPAIKEYFQRMKTPFGEVDLSTINTFQEVDVALSGFLDDTIVALVRGSTTEEPGIVTPEVAQFRWRVVRRLAHRGRCVWFTEEAPSTRSPRLNVDYHAAMNRFLTLFAPVDDGR